MSEEIKQRLIRLAGLNSEDVLRGQSLVPDLFHEIVSAYCDIGGGKHVHYGHYVKNLEDDPELLQVIQLYCEIKRKYKRFDNMIKRMSSGEDVPTDQLLEVMADLGVYSIKGIELFLAQEQKRNAANQSE
jgi:hypothetical protein